MLVTMSAVSASAQERRPASNMDELERKLDQAERDMKTLSGTIEALRSEIDSLKQVPGVQSSSAMLADGNVEKLKTDNSSKRGTDDFADQIIVPDLGGDE